MTSFFKQAYSVLNKRQQEAVDTIYGSVMVIAWPWSGKTQVLSARAARILELTDCRGENILITTFTEAGVIALKKRLFEFLWSTANSIQVTTLHAFAKDIIDRYPEIFLSFRAHYPLDELGVYTLVQSILEEGNFPILSPVHSSDFYLRDIVWAMKNLRKEGVSPSLFLGHIESQKHSYEEELACIDTKLKKYEATKTKQQNHLAKLNELLSIYICYEEEKRKRSCYDFDDMILFVRDALKEHPTLSYELSEQYQFIMIDEFQDLSGAQNELIELILAQSDAPNILTVWDDDQSIYRFQWANLENMFHFSTKFPNTALIVLDTNYRSTPSIIETAQTLITNNTSRISHYIPHIEKKLTSAVWEAGKQEFTMYADSIEEAMGVFHRIEQEHVNNNTPYEEMAILLRTNREVREWSLLAKQLGIPHENRDQWNLLETFECQFFQDILALTEFEIIPNTALLTLLKSWIFQVKHRDIYRLTRELSNYNYSRRTKLSIFDYLLLSPENRTLLFGEESPVWNALIDNILSLRSGMEWSLFERTSRIIRTFQIRDFFRKHSGIAGLSVLAGIQSFIREKEATSGIQSLSDIISLWDRMRKYSIALPYNMVHTDVLWWVKIYTAHQSKWLEFRSVFIPGVLDGVWGNRRVIEKIKLPESILSLTEKKSDSSLEEERLLFFVALTRAKRSRYGSFPASISRLAKLPSLFVNECKNPLKEGWKNSQEAIDDFLSKTIISPSESSPNIAEDINFILSNLESYRLSVSDLSKFLNDPKLWLEESIFRFPFEETPATIFGKTYHKALEIFSLEWKKWKILPDKSFLLDSFEKALSREFLPPHIFDHDLERGKNGLSGWHEEQIGKKPPQEVEYNFSSKNINFEWIPLTGKIDRIDITEEKKLRVIDYKTGRIRSENEMKWLTATSEWDKKYFRQLLFYKLLLSLDGEYQSSEIEALVIDFVEGKEGIYRWVEFEYTSEDEEELKNEIHSAWQKMHDREFWKTIL